MFGIQSAVINSDLFFRFLPTVRCPHTVTVYDVLQVAQTKLSSQKEKLRILKPPPSSRNSDKAQSMIPFASEYSANGSTLCQVSEEMESCTKKGQFQRCILPKKCDSKHGKTETSWAGTISEDKTESLQCCKACSSIEEFLRHL